MTGAAHAVEDLAAEEFGARPSVEALHEPVRRELPDSTNDASTPEARYLSAADGFTISWLAVRYHEVKLRRDAGAVDRSGLENRKGRQALGGSNPSPSAKSGTPLEARR